MSIPTSNRPKSTAASRRLQNWISIGSDWCPISCRHMTVKNPLPADTKYFFSKEVVHWMTEHVHEDGPITIDKHKSITNDCLSRDDRFGIQTCCSTAYVYLDPFTWTNSPMATTGISSKQTWNLYISVYLNNTTTLRRPDPRGFSSQ